MPATSKLPAVPCTGCGRPIAGGGPFGGLCDRCYVAAPIPAHRPVPADCGCGDPCAALLRLRVETPEPGSAAMQEDLAVCEGYEAEIARLRACLETYADADNWGAVNASRPASYWKGTSGAGWGLARRALAGKPEIRVDLDGGSDA